MLRLERIERNNNEISCDALLEDCKERLHLVLNLQERAFRPFSMPKGYEWCNTHIAAARRFLLNTEPLPDKKLIYWG